MFKQCALYRTALTLITSFSFIFLIQAASANPFQVEGVQVDVSAQNAVLARQEAMSSAQMMAWDKMIAALAEEGEPVQYLKTPDPLSIAAMVETMEIRDEQTAPQQYKAAMDVIFSAQAVRHYMASLGISLSIAKQARPVLLLAWYQDIRGAMHLWGDGNLWAPIWADKAGRTDPPLRIPLGDVVDIADLNAKTPADVTPFQLQKLLDRYNLDRAIHVVAKQETPQRLKVTLYENNRELGSEDISAIDVNQDESIIHHQGVTRTLVMLKKQIQQPQSPHIHMPHAQNPDAYNQPYNPGQSDNTDAAQTAQFPALSATRDYSAIARARSLPHWVGMKKRLEKALGPNTIQISSLSPSQIELTMTGPNLYSDLSRMLAVYGLNAQSEPNGQITIRDTQ